MVWSNVQPENSTTFNFNWVDSELINSQQDFKNLRIFSSQRKHDRSSETFVSSSLWVKVMWNLYFCIIHFKSFISPNITFSGWMNYETAPVTAERWLWGQDTHNASCCIFLKSFISLSLYLPLSLSLSLTVFTNFLSKRGLEKFYPNKLTLGWRNCSLSSNTDEENDLFNLDLYTDTDSAEDNKVNPSDLNVPVFCPTPTTQWQ